jgi:DNA-binding MarR family transcriptional regulator
MSGEFSQLKRYLHETLGAEVNPTPWHKGKRLPFFLRNLYTFFEIQLLDASCLLMLDRNEQEQSPATVRKHMDQVQVKWDGEVVYVRARVTAYNRKRLIEHNLPFVVPGNQMYLPMLGIDLREHFKKLRAETHKFSPSTQALVIYVLLHGTTKRIFTPAETAGFLGYSAMTMTRAFDELESADLGDIFLEGRKRCVRFTESAKDIWGKVHPFLRSPVKKRLHIKPLNADLPGPRAGLTALADYTMLAEPVKPVIALSREDWKSLKQSHRVNEFPSPEPGALEIEVWSYAPSLFAKGNVVDRLSLYLSLKESQDERVEAALEEMMKGL